MRKRVPTGVPPHPAAPPAVAAADEWVEAGPAALVRGGPLQNQRRSGCVRALAVKDDGVRAYAGSALGGVFYTSDAGATWTPLDFYSCVKDSAGRYWPADALTVGAVSVLFDPDPTKDQVTVGPGARPASAAWETEASIKGVGIRRAVGPAPTVLQQGTAAADLFNLEATDLEGLIVNALAQDRVTMGVVWAATSQGLRRRPAAGGASWPKVDPGLGSDDTTSVVALQGLGAEPERVYVAAGGKVARSVDGQNFTPVNLPPQVGGRLASIPVGAVRLYPGNLPGKAVVYALADGPRLWRIDDNQGAAVSGVPAELFRTDDQVEGLAGLSLAVYPKNDAAHQDSIAIAGASPYLAPLATTPEAALFIGKVTQTAGTWSFPSTPQAGKPPAEWAGKGLPPGLRTLSWVAGAGTVTDHLWVAGDGGIFRSFQDGALGTFQEANTGLNIAEPVSLGGSQATEAVALAGTRRMGLMRRLSAETWEIVTSTASGGVAVEDANLKRQYAQTTDGGWLTTVDGGRTWSALALFSDKTDPTWKAAVADERTAFAMVSPLAIVAGDSAHGTQRALGTDRVWYEDDAKISAAGSLVNGWVTLPTGDNPFDPKVKGAPLRKRDQLTDKIIALCWGTPDRLYALTYKGVHLLERRADGSWTDTRLYDQEAVKKNSKWKTPKGQIPYDLFLASLAVHDPLSGTGRLYVGTAGRGDVSHLWWFDGQGNWTTVDLLVDKARVDTTVHALAVDPKHTDTVYVGTDVGVWRVTVTFAADHTPTFTSNLIRAAYLRRRWWTCSSSGRRAVGHRF